MMQDWDPASVDDSTSPPTLVAYPDPSNYRLFLGYAVNEIRSAYLAPLKEEPDAQDTIFTWYAVDGYRQYRPLYEEARHIQTPVDGMYRATPDFYPRKPAWWLSGAGAWHGYNWLGNARLHEIEQGDKLFGPLLLRAGRILPSPT